MDLSKAPFARCLDVEYAMRPNTKALRRTILSGMSSQTDFSLLTAPLPPLDQTHFKIVASEKVLLLGVAMLHRMMDNKCQAASGGDYEGESLELFFDLHHDEIGWQQFIFGSDGAFGEYSHLPYPEAHTSAYPLLHPQKWETFEERFAGDFTGAGCRWFFVWFNARDLFRFSDRVGVNVCRSRAGGEFSAWNFPAGNGAPDATGFGILNRESSAQPTPRAGNTAKPKASRDFKMSVTYDPPMCVVANHYTPQRMRDEMALYKSWGVSRLHWIDYSDWPSFWQLPLWRKGYAESVRHCGELLPCAVEQAHNNGLELIADFKVFDLGFNNFNSNEHHAVTREFENHSVPVIPEIAAHPEWTMQSNAAWRQEYSAPVTTLRFFSDEAIREIKPAEVRLLISNDNRTYKPYRGKIEVRQGVLSRPHQRWTPAGNMRDKGSARNWFLELSGLKLSTPFAALQIKGEAAVFAQRGFMLLEAEDGNGKFIAPTIATKSTPDAATKYSFWKEWPGWANVTEPILQRRIWNGNNLGFALRAMTQMPTLLEPTHRDARQVWLQRIEKLLDAGVDGVNLRIMCHHNGTMSYLQHAFAPVVIDEFRRQFKREPEGTPEDYERVRRLRGQAFTSFIRDARALTKARGKRLGVQLESGIEVPPHLDTRMQIFLDYQTWLSEGLIDEVSMKFWTPYSRFVHEKVLPLARQKKIPVHVISRNLNGVLDSRSLETIPQLVADAKQLGFAGYNFYEAANLIEMNSEGVSMPKGLAAPALCKARDLLAENKA